MAEKIEVVFLGSGSAVPTAKKNHPSVLLSYKGEGILFDCGEGTQRQIRKAHINPCKITKLCITHWHGDHILGIPGLLQTLALNGYNRDLDVYGPVGTKKYLGLMLKMFIYEGKINIKVHEVKKGIIFENEDFKLQTEEVFHGTRCLAYSFIEKDKLRIDKAKLKKLQIPHGPHLSNLKNRKDILIGGKKIKHKELTYLEEGKKVSIVLDTTFNDKITKFVENSDLFVCESTFFDEEELAKEHGHMTLFQALKIAKKSKSKKLALMHLSQRYENSYKDFEREAKKQFKESFLAEDLMRIEL